MGLLNGVQNHFAILKYLFSHLFLVCNHQKKQNPADSRPFDQEQLEHDHSLIPFPVPVQSSITAAAIKKKLPVNEYKRVVIQRLKKNENHDEDGEEDPRCAICLDNLEANHEVRELHNCRHVYHKQCLDGWVETGHVTCPFCRAKLLAAEDPTEKQRDPWRSERMMYLFGNDAASTGQALTHLSEKDILSEKQDFAFAMDGFGFLEWNGLLPKQKGVKRGESSISDPYAKLPFQPQISAIHFFCASKRLVSWEALCCFYNSVIENHYLVVYYMSSHPPPPPLPPPQHLQLQSHTHLNKKPITSLSDFIFTAFSLFLIFSSPKSTTTTTFTLLPRISFPLNNPRRFFRIPNMSLPSPSSKSRPNFPNPQSLSDWLKPRLPSDSFASWGVKPGTKNVHNLWLELSEGETLLADSTPPIRTVEVVVVRVIGKDNKVLIESHQQLSNGDVRNRCRPLSEKMKPGESVEAAVFRAVKEELGSIIDVGLDSSGNFCTNGIVKIVPNSYSKKVEERVSVSYPGLPACYLLHTVDAVVVGLPEGEFCTEEVEEYADSEVKRVAEGAVSCKKHFWKWVDPYSV
ncbi:hypothetical protein ACH5RR_019867 [Cinchona calisaya]|uniref:RING-type domain-containing protein n=1 Tax=Cinchona calisaya TaxID=153742 RepID=A0ABD2ZVW0_9GENT